MPMPSQPHVFVLATFYMKCFGGIKSLKICVYWSISRRFCLLCKMYLRVSLFYFRRLNSLKNSKRNRIKFSHAAGWSQPLPKAPWRRGVNYVAWICNIRVVFTTVTQLNNAKGWNEWHRKHFPHWEVILHFYDQK